MSKLIVKEDFQDLNLVYIVNGAVRLIEDSCIHSALWQGADFCSPANETDRQKLHSGEHNTRRSLSKVGRMILWKKIEQDAWMGKRRKTSQSSGGRNKCIGAGKYGESRICDRALMHHEKKRSRLIHCEFIEAKRGSCIPLLG
jgi:hypothetical protein